MCSFPGYWQLQQTCLLGSLHKEVPFCHHHQQCRALLITGFYLTSLGFSNGWFYIVFLYNWISNQTFHMSTQWNKHIQKPCQNKGPHHLFGVSEYFSVKDIFLICKCDKFFFLHLMCCAWRHIINNVFFLLL